MNEKMNEKEKINERPRWKIEPKKQNTFENQESNRENQLKQAKKN